MVKILYVFSDSLEYNLFLSVHILLHLLMQKYIIAVVHVISKINAVNCVFRWKHLKEYICHMHEVH